MSADAPPSLRTPVAPWADGDSLAATGLPDPIHCVGVGGGGLSVLASLLASLGHCVRGSDRNGSGERGPPGVTVLCGHDEEHLGDARLVVRSAAVPDDNPEVAAARARGLPVLKYSEALGRLMAGRHGVAVAGTHGKTTTTALVAHLLAAAGSDPSWIVGGRPLGAPPARWGRGPFVAEACEYDHSFLNLSYEVALVLSVAPDHLDCFGDAAGVTRAFRRFAERLPPGGALVLGPDVPSLPWPGHVRVLRAAEEAPLLAVQEQSDGFWGRIGGRGQEGAFRLSLLGRHNLANLQAALVAAAEASGRPLVDLLPHVQTFAGVGRRLQDRGERCLGGPRVRLLDDFAHHPDALRAAARAARGRFPGRRAMAVFHPHQVSRTEDLLDDFAAALADFDGVALCDIFVARDRHPERAEGALDALAARVPGAVRVGPAATADSAVVTALRDGDLCLVMGAGDVDGLAVRLAGQAPRP